MKIIISLLFLVALTAGLGIYRHRQGGATAAPDDAPPKVIEQAELQNKPDPKLVDYALVDQDGKDIKLYKDLLKGRIVVMNFIFTTCKVICEGQGKRFSELQTALGDRSGDEVNLISITKDPPNDTPDKLKQWGARHNRQKGWTLLTGETAEINNAFRAFTGEGALVIEHVPIMLIGNPDKNKWIRTGGYEPVSEIEKMIERVR